MDKKSLSEEDIKNRFITPAIEAGWDKQHIRMEKAITDGRVNIRGNLAVREKPKRADYVLYKDGVYPLAIVEAKDNQHSLSFGLQQAKEYCLMMDVKFAYSSNGDGFEEYDFLTGVERTLTLDAFPSEKELMERYVQESSMTEDELKALTQPYYVSANTYAPRYYQQVAVDRTMDAIARGQKRILLVMATGTGKTYTAFQTVWRLRKSGLVKKVLYLADRNILVDQSIQQDFAPLEKVIHKVNFAKDDRTTLTSYEIYFALYQQMVGNDEKEHFRELFDPDFFDLVIVDECHRGSAKEESRWRRVLAYFDKAVQIGMTATPKETAYVSSTDYFGEPVYTYSLKQGIEDGFLAPFRVINVHTNIGDGWRPRKGQLDAFGNPVEDRIYNNLDYDKNIVIEDRTREVARQITDYLEATGPYQKTIVFCETEAAAERMRAALAKANPSRMRENPDYVVRITGSDDYGKKKLQYFISVSSRYPVIATTSELLSTGVDCKMVKLIALDRNIASMTLFKQIVGRGTRLRTEDGKYSFVIMDFRDVTRLFADPDWDGPVEPNPDFGRKKKPGIGERKTPYGGEGNDDDDDDKPKSIPVIRPDGCRVYVLNRTISIYDSDGKLLKQEDIIDYTKENVQGTFGSLSAFISTWNREDKKKVIADILAKQGIDLDKLKKSQHMEDVDDFDFICHIAYGQKPLTRRERAEQVKKKDIFHRYGGAAREVLDILLDKYMNLGIKEIEKPEILKMKEFRKYGTPAGIARLFGGRNGFFEAIRELKKELYEKDVG
ncbi:EcoAI/FtnUII family type I restriction enzme subunit R [uncultured Dialister sp.]|mgnify:FL=1|uniref:EcoAI/FtnUII family type I restriction enzme subunit R n=1 Tax=uncultured Dialister sp. TaxID=278064 RepID=UPI0025E3B7E7|nr:DEAD/DEAH box helicase family protein [uncultured Dialister sp.]